MIVILPLGNTPWLCSRRKGPMLSTALKSIHDPAPSFQPHLPQSLHLMRPVFGFTRWQYLPFCLCTFKILCLCWGNLCLQYNIEKSFFKTPVKHHLFCVCFTDNFKLSPHPATGIEPILPSACVALFTSFTIHVKYMLGSS